MKELHEYMKVEAQKTGWPFFRMADLINIFGHEETRTALNQLYIMEKIKKRDGGNGIIVELLTT